MPITPEVEHGYGRDSIPAVLGRARRSDLPAGSPVTLINRAGDVRLTAARIAEWYGIDADAVARHCRSGERLRATANRTDALVYFEADWIAAGRDRAANTNEVIERLPRSSHIAMADYFRIYPDGSMVLYSGTDHSSAEIIRYANTGEPTAGGLRYVWAHDWNRATRELSGSIPEFTENYLRISDDGPEPINQVAYVGRYAARCAAVVRDSGRSTGGVTAVVMSDQVTHYRSAAAASRATGFSAGYVRVFCQTGRGRGRESVQQGATQFFWSRDWNNASIVPEGQPLAGIGETPDENGIFIRAGGIFRGDVRNRIGLITRCGLGHYVRMDSTAGQVDYFHLELANVHAWIRANANGTAEARPEVDEDSGPQPATIRQPDGRQAWFDHRGRLRTGETAADAFD